MVIFKLAAIMKTLFKFFVPMAAAVIAFASCQQEQYNSKNTLQITVSAIPDEIKPDPVAEPASEDVKTYISENKIYWGTGEYMKIGVSDGTSTKWADSSDATADIWNGEYQNAYFTFSVSVDPADAYTYYGLYPASAAVASSNTNPASYKVNLPSTQSATAISYDPKGYILVAQPEGEKTVANANWNAFFRRATALNKVTLKNIPNGVSIKRVTITAPTGKYLAGARHIDLTTGLSGDIYNGGGRTETVEVKYATPLSGSGEGTWNADIWFTSWNVEVAESETLTIVAYTSNQKSYTKEITVPSGKSIKFQEGCLNTLGAKMNEGTVIGDVTELEEGDYVVLAKDGDNYYALKAEKEDNKQRLLSVAYEGSRDSYLGDADIIWSLTKSGDSFIFENDSKYLGYKGSSNESYWLEADENWTTTNYLLDVTAQQTAGLYYVTLHSNSARYLSKNSSDAFFAFYGNTGQKADIVFVPATEDTRTPVTLSFAESSISKTTSNYNEFTGQSATASPSVSPITYAMTGDAIGSITSGSTVLLNGTTGTATVTATFEGNDTYRPATASYTIEVTGSSSVTLTDSEITAGSNTAKGTNNGKLAYRLGTGSNDGSITFDAGYSTISFTLAGWASGTRSFSITNGTINDSASLSPAAGSPSGTINANFSTSYSGTEYTIVVTDPTQEVVFSGRRCVVWGFTATAGSSVTWNLESIAITTAPTKTEYTEGESFDPTGMVVTGHFVDADDNTNTKDEAVTGYTVSPDGALATTDDHVTITYQGQTTNQSITVNAAATPTYDFENIAELNALVTSTSASYDGYLTNAVVSFVPATNTAIVKDATGSVMIYKSNHGLLQGQTYTGEISVTAIKYNSLYSEITAWSGATFAGSQASVAPESVSLANLIGHYDDYQNAYVSVSGLTVVSVSSKNINVTDGTNNYVVFDNPGTATCGAGDVITAVGTITKYQTTEELKIWDASAITITAGAPKAITFSPPTQTGCSFTVNVSGVGNINSGDTVAAGATVTLTATAGADYEFSSWTVNGATLADASTNPASFTMGTSAVSISANFTSTGGNQQTPTLQYTLDGTVTATGNAYATASTVTQNNIGWGVTGNTEQNPWRIGGKSITAVDRAIYSTTAIAANITQINVTSGATASSLTVNSLTISVHNSASDALNGTNAIATKTVTSNIASSTVTFDKEDNTSWAGKYYRIVYNVTRTSSSGNGYITFESATFYGTN